MSKDRRIKVGMLVYITHPSMLRWLDKPGPYLVVGMFRNVAAIANLDHSPIRNPLGLTGPIYMRPVFLEPDIFLYLCKEAIDEETKS